jgi:MFS family permease
VQTRWVLLAMGLIWALTQFPMIGSVWFETLVTCRIALGTGEGPATPVALHSAYKWFPNELRTLPTAVIVQGGAIGVMVALPLLNWVIVRWTGHWAFGSLGLIGLLWCTLWLVFGREGSLDNDREKPKDAAQSSPRLGYAQLLLNPTILACWAAALGATGPCRWRYRGKALTLALRKVRSGSWEHCQPAAARSRCLRRVGIRNACCRAAYRPDWRAASSAG